MLLAIYCGLLFFWVGMSVASYLAYLATTVKLFGNKHKLVFGLPYSAVAWPHVLYHVIKGEN